MKIGDGIVTALKMIRSRKLRTALNIIGVMLGCASVISIVCLGDSGSSAVVAKFEKMGIDCVAIKSAVLTERDIDFLRNTTENAAITPVYMNYGKVQKGDKTVPVIVWGIAPGYEEIFDINIEKGRNIADYDVARSRTVAVTEHKFYDTFGGGTVTLTAKNRNFDLEIIGVAEGGNEDFAIFSESVPQCVYIPYNTAMRIYSAIRPDYISIKPIEGISPELEGIRAVRRLERNTGQFGRYYAENMAQQKEILDSVLDIIKLILGCIAAISLIVGTIGIVNVMLIAVSERTPEIGMMKAIGAKNRDIILQFVTEAAVITFIGAVSGALLGTLIASVLSSYCGFSMVCDIGKIIGITAAVVAFGIIFGVYPAKVAAGLDPAEILR